MYLQPTLTFSHIYSFHYFQLLQFIFIRTNITYADVCAVKTSVINIHIHILTVHIFYNKLKILSYTYNKIDNLRYSAKVWIEVRLNKAEAN